MSAAKTKKKRQRTHRYTSNVFSMFSQAQIQEFKEAFNMIDQNRDGFVDKDDLIEMLTSLGKNPDDRYLDGMINEAPGPINFTMFLTLFGEKLNGTDPEEVIRNAFGCFDMTNMGTLQEDRLREIMTTMGDRWTDEKVDELFHGAPINQGLFDYIEFTRTLKHGAREKDEDTAPPPPNSAPPIPQTPTPTDKVVNQKPKIVIPPKPPQEAAPKPSAMKTTDSNKQPKSPIPPKSPNKAPPFGAVLKPAGKSALKKV